MNTTQLSVILSNCAITKPYFRTVVPIDYLLSAAKMYNKNEKNIFVVNVLESGEGFGHWVLIFVYPNNELISFVDSFAVEPAQYDKRFVIFLRKFSKTIDYCPYAVQQNRSCTCGLYCVFFAIYLTLGYSLDTITRWFSPARKLLNDKSVIAFIRERVYIPSSRRFLTCSDKLPKNSQGQLIVQCGFAFAQANMDSAEIEHLPRIPFTGILVGSTCSGKSTYVKNLLLQWDHLYPNNPLRKVVIVYAHYQPDCYGAIEDKYGAHCVLRPDFTPEVLSEEVIGPMDKDRPAVVILDDCAFKIASNPLLCELYVAISHHKNVIPLTIAQNFYCSPSNYWRTMTRNCSCIWLFNMARDQSTLLTLGRQLFPTRKQAGALLLAYQEAFSELQKLGFTHPCLFVDAQLHTSEHLCDSVHVIISVLYVLDPKHRLRCGLLPNEPKLCWVPE